MQQFGPYLTAQHFDNGIVSVLKQMGDANAQLALEVCHTCSVHCLLYPIDMHALG